MHLRASNMPPQPRQSMKLRVLLPFGVFLEKDGVSRIVAHALGGSFGLLPHRLDCVAALMPGILTYQTEAHGEAFVAVDEGILIKTGQDVFVSVRRAQAGDDVTRLRDAVEHEFLVRDAQEQDMRTAMVKHETGFMRRFASFQHDR